MKKKRSILLSWLIYIFVVLAMLILLLFLRDEGESVLLILTFSIIVLFLAGFIYFFVNIYYPLIRFKQNLEALSKGEVLDVKRNPSVAEISDMEDSYQMHIDRLKIMMQIADNLADGNVMDGLDVPDRKDELGKALQKVMDSIVVSKSESLQRRKLDEQQNWASQGLAKFGEMLRDFENNVESLSNAFIRELVAYVEMEVGGIFLVKNVKGEEPELVLSGAYAFDREKYAEISFRPGEGLVGRCALERASILITDVPKDYIRIRSGLGEDRPSAILLIPVIFDEKVIGVIELASFSEVPKYKIDFLETLGRSIASSLSKSVAVGI